MEKISNLRGIKDILFEEADKFSEIINIARNKSQNFGFKPAYFPIIEDSKVYNRTLGEDSDIVNKEMYSFLDKGENNVTMRPEFTAGIVRSVISNSLYDKMPLKFFSYGPLFRYERPQKGRQRQFHQINFEYFGNSDYLAEIEIFLMIEEITKGFGINKDLNLELNFLGEKETQNLYREILVEFLSKYKSDLSEDSKRRLDSNPLRILDSKDEGDKKILVDAPEIFKAFSDSDKEFFDKILQKLEEFKISYKINQKLVRGLDYYNKTVFEYTTDKLGSQNAVFAGGRYDQLVSNMGGMQVPAIGCAGGVERISELMKENFVKQNIAIVIINISDGEEDFCFNLLNELRVNNISGEFIAGSKSLSKKLNKANKFDPKYVLVIGEEEKKNGSFELKDFQSGQKIVVQDKDLIKKLKSLLG